MADRLSTGPTETVVQQGSPCSLSVLFKPLQDSPHFALGAAYLLVRVQATPA